MDPGPAVAHWRLAWPDAVPEQGSSLFRPIAAGRCPNHVTALSTEGRPGYCTNSLSFVPALPGFIRDPAISDCSHTGERSRRTPFMGLEPLHAALFWSLGSTSQPGLANPACVGEDHLKDESTCKTRIGPGHSA